MTLRNRVLQFGAVAGPLAWEGLLDLICSHRCLRCDTPDLDRDDELCATCLRVVEEAAARSYCRRCGKTVPPYGLRSSGCGACQRERWPFDMVIRVGTYSGAWASLLRLFKYGGREEFDAFFARRLARRIAQSSVYEEVDAVVAVPTCWQHRLRRAFHPALVVGRQVARRCEIPFADVLTRIGGGPHQVGQPRSARLENVHGKFRVSPGCSVRGARLCLVDDVMTSGATVSECSRVLKRAGAAEVFVAVLARAADDPVTLLRV